MYVPDQILDFSINFICSKSPSYRASASDGVSKLLFIISN